MRTYVISIIFHDQKNIDYKEDEFYQLACSLSALSIKKNTVIRLTKSHPAFFLSKGHLHNIRNYVADNDIGLVLIDNPLSPVQQRNLEKKLITKVLDRTGLVLEIFGSRAQSKEGMLQVELAHLLHQKSWLEAILKNWAPCLANKHFWTPCSVNKHSLRHLTDSRLVSLIEDVEQP